MLLPPPPSKLQVAFSLVFRFRPGGKAMSIIHGTTVIGIFDDQNHALEALRALRRAGFTEEQIGLASRHGAGEPELAQVDTHKRARDGAITGAAVGGGIGAVAGAVVAGAGPLVGPGLAC